MQECLTIRISTEILAMIRNEARVRQLTLTGIKWDSRTGYEDTSTRPSVCPCQVAEVLPISSKQYPVSPTDWGQGGTSTLDDDEHDVLPWFLFLR